LVQTLKKTFYVFLSTIVIVMFSACVSQVPGRLFHSNHHLKESTNASSNLPDGLKSKGIIVESFDLTGTKRKRNYRVIAYILPRPPEKIVYSRQQFEKINNFSPTELIPPIGKVSNTHEIISVDSDLIDPISTSIPDIVLKEPNYLDKLMKSSKILGTSKVRAKTKAEPGSLGKISGKNFKNSKLNNPAEKTFRAKSDVSGRDGIGNQESTSIKFDREVFARVNDRVEISYDGEGWIYTGFKTEDPKGSSDETILFLGKKAMNNRSIFTFKPRKLGVYTLKFVSQNNETGKSTHRYVKLKVVTDRDFTKILNSDKSKKNQRPDSNRSVSNGTDFPESLSQNSKSTPNSDEKTLRTADYLFANKDYTDALHLYLKNYTPENRYLNDRLAQIYFLQKSYEAAAKYWKRNLEDESGKKDLYYCNAIVGIVKIAAVTNDIITLVEYMNDFSKINAKTCSIVNSYQRDYCFIIRKLLRNKRYDIALKFGETFLARYPHSSYMDEIYYYMGNIYESSETQRDLQKALIYYRKIYRNYPSSKFYLEAKRKIDYIMEHFFYVR